MWSGIALADWRTLLAVAAGGGFGSVLRYVIGLAAVQRFGPGFPIGTLTVNVLGSFAIGLVAELAQTRALGISPGLRVFLAAGVLGGFTTFSAFSYETVGLVRDGAPSLALAYAIGSVAAGIAAAYAGMVLARLALP